MLNDSGAGANAAPDHFAPRSASIGDPAATQPFTGASLVHAIHPNEALSRDSLDILHRNLPANVRISSAPWAKTGPDGMRPGDRYLDLDGSKVDPNRIFFPGFLSGGELPGMEGFNTAQMEALRQQALTLIGQIIPNRLGLFSVHKDLYPWMYKTMLEHLGTREEEGLRVHYPKSKVYCYVDAPEETIRRACPGFDHPGNRGLTFVDLFRNLWTDMISGLPDVASMKYLGKEVVDEGDARVQQIVSPGLVVMRPPNDQSELDGTFERFAVHGKHKGRLGKGKGSCPLNVCIELPAGNAQKEAGLAKKIARELISPLVKAASDAARGKPRFYPGRKRPS